MYKMNLLLKFIITILFISIIVIANNRIVLWLLLFLLTFYNLYKYKKISLFIDLLLVLLLGFSTQNEICLLVFKLLFIINILITVYYTLNMEEKLLLINEKTSEKQKYFENNFDRIVNNIKERKNSLYDEDTSIDSKIERDLERNYLQSKIRYYNISNSNNKYYNWNRIDILILIFVIIVFVILFILR